MYFRMHHISKTNYIKEILETALEIKKNKSDNKMTLLIYCAYTSYGLLFERRVLCREYFKKSEQKIGGLWQHIFVVFSDGNVQLR